MENRRIGIDAIRSLELREMEEEERYLECLKLQRDKIDALKKDSAKKDKVIEELKLSLAQKTDAKPLEEKIVLLANTLKAKEKDSSEMKAQHRKVIQDYEQALEELQDLVKKEREEKSRAIARLKQKTQELEEENAALKKAGKDTSLQLFSYKQSAESQIEELKQSIDAHSKQASKQKELIDSLTQEKAYLETRAKECAEHAKQLQLTKEVLEETQANLKKVSQQLQTQETANDALEHQLQTQQFEHEKLLKKYKEQASNLNDELNRAIDLISRQETTIVEIRYRIQEDAALIAKLRENAASHKSQCESLEKKLAHATSLYTEAERQLTALESETQGLRKTNESLSHQLQETIDKHQQEAAHRKQLSQMRLEKLQERKEEISRLTNIVGLLPYS